MVGVLINVAAIIVGTIAGLLFKKLFNEKTKTVVMQALGIAVLAIGVMDALKTENVVILILSLTIGGFLGSLCHIQDGIERFGNFLQAKLAKSEEDKVGAAFVNATLIFCVGAMIIYGSIQAGLGNNTTLYIKSILDGAMSIMLAATLGWGVILSAIPVLIIQGVIALCASFISPIATTAFLNQLSGIGGVLVMCIGINILEIKKIRTADMLPAVLGAFAVFLLDLF